MSSTQIASRRRMASRARRMVQPTAEPLESRLLLYATSGGRWYFGSVISYSIVPDGTDIGGIPSNLNSALYNRFNQTWGWRNLILEAAATWQATSEINLTYVDVDHGIPYGGPGAQQGDWRMGDIRIGGSPLPMNVLALCFATPPFNGGTLAGDIVINTNQPWAIDGNAYDFLSVVLHEFGHALGMGHSSWDTSSISTVMYPQYNYTKHTPATDDLLGIRSIYGAPALDIFDAASNNYHITTSSPITNYLNPQGQITLVGLDILGDEVDWYWVQAPPTALPTMTATMQSKYISSLSPLVEIYDASLRKLGTAGAPYSYGSIVTATANGILPNQHYFIRATGANYGPSGEGGYALRVNFGSAPTPPPILPNTYIPTYPNAPGGTTWTSTTTTTANANANANAKGKASNPRALERSDENSAHHQDQEVISVGTLSGLGDTLTVDEYRAHAPQAAPATSRPRRDFRTAVSKLRFRAEAPIAVLPPASTPTPIAWERAASPARNRARSLADRVELLDRVLEEWKVARN